MVPSLETDMDNSLSVFSALECFLCDAFDIHEFDVFLRSYDRFHYMVKWIEIPRSKAHYFDAVVGLLQRHRLLDQDFFLALSQVRPHRVDEISVLAGLHELENIRFSCLFALKQAQQLLPLISTLAPIVMYAKDIAGRFILSNQCHATLLGRSPTAVLGNRERDLLPVEIAEQIDAEAQVAIREHRMINSQLTIPFLKGSRTFFESVFPLIDRQGHCYGLGGVATEIGGQSSLNTASHD